MSAAQHEEGPWGTGSHAGALRAPQADSVGCGGKQAKQSVPGVPEWIVDKVVSVILFDHDGTYWIGDRGEVLHNLADECGIPYKRVARAVQLMELMGWLYVERNNPVTGSRQNNHIIRIVVI